MLEQVSVTYSGFSLEIPKLTVTCGVTLLAGPNGAGKTTLLHSLAGLIRKAKGRITLNGAPLQAENLGMLPQNPTLPRDLTPVEVLRYTAWLHRDRSNATIGQARTLLERFDLAEYAERPCRKLSGGTIRRLAICCAIAHSPQVVLLDEPTNDLDPIQRRSILSMIHELGQERIVIVSSHALADLSSVTDDLILLREGTSLFHGSVQEFRTAYQASADDDLDEVFIAAMSSPLPNPKAIP
ncbi:ABC transporter ATP-binding protein [Devriesea agamarum]|uniref:ABC transporter ATP-binding protein n=1 Tax=Devriesea agamarum TaxID=472569 RepID=UPI00155EC4F4|nr:ABC transporter ATP-binding protein [Devriesea agamarum]